MRKQIISIALVLAFAISASAQISKMPPIDSVTHAANMRVALTRMIGDVESEIAVVKSADPKIRYYERTGLKDFDDPKPVGKTKKQEIERLQKVLKGYKKELASL